MTSVADPRPVNRPGVRNDQGFERRTQQQRRAEAREALIRAATELFGTKGYGGTTLFEIGRLAGVSRGLVTYHFGSKAACIREVVLSIRFATIAALEVGADGLRGLDALDHVIERYLRGYESGTPGGRALFVAITEAISATPELKDLVLEQTQAFWDILSQRLDEARTDGHIPPSADSHAQAVLIAGLLRGVALQWLVDASTVDLAELIPAAQRMVRAALTQRSALGPVKGKR